MAGHERTWVQALGSDPSAAYADWDPFCQSPAGVFAVTRYVDRPPELPALLAEARERLAAHVVDERTLDHPTAPFNGPRYCLRAVAREVRRFGERAGCILEFGPSDYRTFLVTNGLDGQWAGPAGLAEEFVDIAGWVRRWAPDPDGSTFFQNSFGVNVLVSVFGPDGGRRLIFNERAKRMAVRPHSTVGSADEGLRRSFEDHLFDQVSGKDPTPDLACAVTRAVEEELGLLPVHTRGTRPILLSVGRARSVCQPGALYYWPLRLRLDDFRLLAASAPDRHYEIDCMHAVPLSLDDVVRFIQEQEATAPVESWVAAMAMYALQARPQRSIFVSHSHHDARFAREVAQRLEARGHFVWLAEGELATGDPLLKLFDAVQRADFVVLLISSASNQSNWVKAELEQALADEKATGSVKVLPLRLDECEMPAELEDRLFSECRTRAEKERALRRLVSAIER